MDTFENIVRDPNMSKIAIMGGSYNPITSAHIQIARYVYDNTDVNFVWLMPCNKHLQKNALESFEHRYEMCKIASERYKDFIKVSDWEMQNPDGSAYSLISLIKEVFNPGCRDYFFNSEPPPELSYIIGMDQANNFHTWKNWEKLKDLVRFIVIPRLGVEPDPNITWYLDKPHIYLKDFPAIDTSATRVRELLKRPTSGHKILNQLLNKYVFAYICDERLYE